MTEPYKKLEAHFRNIGLLGDVSAIVHWDMAAMMPAGGAESRSEQMAYLSTLSHEMITAPDVTDWLAGAEDQADALSAGERANIREMKRRHRHATALDSDLVAALSKSGSACEQVWRQARPDGDFAAVVPTLKEVLNLTRQAAARKGEVLGCSPYDALLDQYEPDGRAADIDALFAPLEAFLPDFLAQVVEAQKGWEAAAPQGPFSLEKQKALGQIFMTALGFDFDHGRLDVSLHPFCGGTPEDVRLTTRYDEADFTSALMGVLHETGHALYEQGLPKAWRYQPVGQARGMSVHESQSLLVEMQLCRSDAFLAYALPVMRDVFGAPSNGAWSDAAMTRLYRRVQPDFIRVDADEVTYPAHVILRYRLERALIAGEMEVEDIPAAWNEHMQKLLGVTPPSDREGCLQDIHWYDGAWGYFPTYTMGAMTAAQVFQAARDALPDLDEAIRQGQFAPLFAWLRTHIHSQGSKLSTPDLLRSVSGKSLSADSFIAHLKTRYGAAL